jgi:hypothetical protein
MPTALRRSTTWGFAIYRASHEDYQDSILPTGYPGQHPARTLDCACGLYLGDTTAWLTSHPRGINQPARPLEVSRGGYHSRCVED